MDMQSNLRPVSRSRPGVLALAAAALAAGCDDGPSPVAVPTTILLSLDSAVLQDAGDSVRITAIVLDQYSYRMPWIPVTWSASDSFVVKLSGEITGEALVTADEPGETLVRVSADSVTAEAKVMVEPSPRAVLHKFYRMTGGDGWVNNSGWRKDIPLGDWFGVWPNRAGDVRSLVLPENGLAGEIPPELASLDSLDSIELQSNELTGPIPPELGNLSELERLYLQFNELTGPIPPELGNLSKLNTLFLSGNKLTGSVPGEIGNIGNLGFGFLNLLINDNPLTGPLPRELTRLTRLSTFYWSNTDLCAPTDEAFQMWLDGIRRHEGNGDCSP